MRFGLREKAVAITTSILLVTIGLNVLVGTHLFRTNYFGALKSEMYVICLNLKSQLQRIGQLGIPVRDIQGFERQCQEVLAAHEDVAYAMIVQADGRILFHSDPSRHGTRLQDDELLRALTAKYTTLCEAEEGGREYYNMTIPVEGTVDTLDTAAIIGVPADLVNGKTQHMMFIGLATGLISAVAATVLLLVSLSASMTKPLSNLLTTIQEISSSSDLSKRVEIVSADEIGVLAQAFNHMTEDLRQTTTSVDNLNREIAVRHQAEEGQAALIDRVNSINKELKDFAYVVSHDLKAPLRGVKTLAQWIQEDCSSKLDPENREQLDLLMNRVDRMHNLIEGVLQYSRIGRVEEQVSLVDLDKLVPEIIDMIQPPDHIRVVIEDRLGEVECGETHISQIFQNLLSNAIKYMDKPEGLIRVGRADTGNDWTFSVADNGPGIEEKYFEQIFRIFQTLDRKDEYESTGIGLTVTKKIVEEYGGHIRVESEVGAGTTFLFTLPKCKRAPVPV